MAAATTSFFGTLLALLTALTCFLGRDWLAGVLKMAAHCCPLTGEEALRAGIGDSNCNFCTVPLQLLSAGGAGSFLVLLLCDWLISSSAHGQSDLDPSG